MNVYVQEKHLLFAQIFNKINCIETAYLLQQSHEYIFL
jgi:hypothetical protein